MHLKSSFEYSMSYIESVLTQFNSRYFSRLKEGIKQPFNPNIETNKRVQKQAFNPKFPDGRSCSCFIPLCVEKMKKVTLFVTSCDIEIGVNYPYKPCHRLTLLHF